MRDIHAVCTESREILAKTGIYYEPDETNILHGTAMLVGQKGTPYHGGFYFFDIVFPAEYPFVPIIVKTLTQDGTTRFNPNMYLNGKVCLSILNTWHDGPPWSSVQTLESVLLVLMADVLNTIPLNNEPAYHEAGLNDVAKIYNRMLFQANIETAILRMLRNPPPFAAPFQATMRAVFRTNLESVSEAADALVHHDGRSEMLPIFSMTTKYRFGALRAQLSEEAKN
jgi:ubiquitin-protein ligase